ncbi:MAG: YihY/virulence factor BrkB family protein [Muribaculum sp.]|nr:YihY/virulence factor BrkB family protein [Muribaculum sp.]
MADNEGKKESKMNAFIRKWVKKGLAFWNYASSGVWNDTRQTWQVNAVKTINLSVRSFLNSDLQYRASALTYNTLLAIVPALAMLFAIGRGFGFQNLLQSQLTNMLPSQKHALETALSFVDGYLSEASQGIFVGVGLVVLLWTLISLMSNIEDSLNLIWGVTRSRTFGRKIIDYTAIMFLLPILMICSSGLSVFMSTTLIEQIHFKFFTPAIKLILDLAPFVLVWLAFIGMYLLFPNTKVKLKNAVISGIFAGTAFQILQYLFVSGQLYVSKYNAIYGSFAFLPLLLVWLQLTWTITLAGAVLCYSSQNIFQFSFTNDVTAMSLNYRRKVAVAIITVIVKRFEAEMKPLSATDFAAIYHMPARLVTILIHEMTEAGLLSTVITGNDTEEHSFQPAMDINAITLGYVLNKLNSFGSHNFIPGFNEDFKELIPIYDDMIQKAIDSGQEVLIKDIPIDISIPDSKIH